jgi:hypothetical protein
MIVQKVEESNGVSLVASQIAESQIADIWKILLLQVE